MNNASTAEPSVRPSAAAVQAAAETDARQGGKVGPARGRDDARHSPARLVSYNPAEMYNGYAAGPAEDTKEIQPPPVRVRKRSMFARKPPKPSTTHIEAVPTQQGASSGGLDRPQPAMHSSSMGRVLGASSRQSAASSPSSNAVPSHRTHRRSPSASAIGSTHILSDTPVPGSDALGNSDNVATSTGNRQLASEATVRRNYFGVSGHGSSWYQRGTLGRLKPRASMSKERESQPPANASESASEMPRESASTSPTTEDKQSVHGTVPPSPDRRNSSIMRSPSRLSILSFTRDDVGTRDNVTSTSRPSSPSREKRRLFGRASRSNTVDSNERPLNLQMYSDSRGEERLRRMNSRNLSSVAKSGIESNPAASTDSLGSIATTSSSSRGAFRRRASDMINNATQTKWGRRSGAGSSDTTSQEDVCEQERGDHQKQSRAKSSHQNAQMQRQTKTADTSAASALAGDHDGPSRFGGWLSNVLSSNQQSAARSSPESSAREAAATNVGDGNGTTASFRAQTQPPNIITASGPGGKAPQNQPAAKPKGGLLSSLTASGRARAEGGASPHSGAARSGLDRAIRYFIDNGDPQDGIAEGIWLLGVWHGPLEPEATTATPADTHSHCAQQHAQSGRRASLTAATNCTDSSKLGSELDVNDASSSESGARRTRETSPSLASASSIGSTRAKEAPRTIEQSNDSKDLQVVARNPPTPHASPIATHRRFNDFEVEAASSPNVTTPASLLIPPEKTISFQADFSSRIWCTYRSHFTPIARDGTISQQAEDAAVEAAAREVPIELSDAALIDNEQSAGCGGNVAEDSRLASPELAPQNLPNDATLMSNAQGALGSAFGMAPSPAPTPAPTPSGLGERMGIPNLWNRATAAAQAYGLAGRSGLTTDAGWGCMLRTGQSLLANTLVSFHLGRQWRRTSRPAPSHMFPSADTSSIEKRVWQHRRNEYAQYVRILSWFMDEPSLACPFGVHRMAREGKRLGKEVGEWFGPSTAAGAIKKLVEDYPSCGIGVSVASDGVVYLNQVRAQAAIRSGAGGVGRNANPPRWDRPVLILIGIRLGLDGVHPMYHDSVKATFSFPHSVGISGGRPSSSYYFVGYQGNSLFYLDPHHVRSTVPFKHPPPGHEEDPDWWNQVYSEQELSTFHNDRPRRMPMKSLDPSMLLGFLVQDEESFNDFVSRVNGLPRPIFSVLESMPKWMMDDNEADLDDERAIESISESSADEPAGDEVSDAAKSLSDIPAVPPAAQMQRASPQSSPQAKHSSIQMDRSCLSASTTTPQSDTTFEFVEGQHQRRQRRSEDSVRRHRPVGTNAGFHTFPTVESCSSGIGTLHDSGTDERTEVPHDKPFSAKSHGDERVVMPASSSASASVPHPDETLSSNYSVVSESDNGSAWEELQQGGGGDVINGTVRDTQETAPESSQPTKEDVSVDAFESIDPA